MTVKHKARLDRTASKRAVRISLAIVTVFFIVEVVTGVLTNSLALIADAGHLLTDVGALSMTLMAFWYASKPVSPSRTYGNYRIEILAALGNGLTLWVVAAYIGVQSYHRLLNPPEVLSGPMTLVAFLGFVAQMASALILMNSSRDNLNVRGAFVHVATDAVQSTGIVVAGLLMLLFGWYIADPIVSVLTALLIVYTGGRIVFQAAHVLLEGSPASIDVAALQKAFLRTPGVQAVHDLHTWSITSGYNALSAHVVLKDEVTPQQSQSILSQLRDLAMTRYGIGHVTIQMEGGSLECEEDHEPVPTSTNDSTSRSDR